jgi:CubicO group peptidase (beta-lactamase class C family)
MAEPSVGGVLAEVDAVFERFLASEPAPGLAYGVVMGGTLVHARGLGTARIDDELRPDPDTVFRIASMTKSFTAAAVVLLRDEGRLRLDDPVIKWIPELRGSDRPTKDSPQMTIEQLMTMSAGLPTDDPWGDRQQGLRPDRFDDLIRAGLTFAWAPGTSYEYSNLGYGLLGRIVTRVAGIDYHEFVGERFLRPLGMNATTFHRHEIPDDRLALGYVRRGEAWLEEPIDPYGALASMGGLFTTVSDLARWVVGFADAYPPRDEPEGGHPLSRASRREMQQVHRAEAPSLSWERADALPTLESGGYGYGLAISHDLRLGPLVSHGGGYPGFGSHMRWHPASGIGVIGFANARYTRMDIPVREALAVLVASGTGRVSRWGPWRETLAARTAVEKLLDTWDDDVARSLFAMNVDLDEPFAHRKAAVEQLREVHGPLRPDPSEEPRSDSPAHLAWWMAGARGGRVHVEVLLDPERPPLVQKLTLTSVPEPPVALQRAAEAVVAALTSEGQGWPSTVALADDADAPAIERSFRATEALFAPLTLGATTAGDGRGRATWCLVGRGGEVDMTLELDSSGDVISSARFVPRTLTEPAAER